MSAQIIPFPPSTKAPQSGCALIDALRAKVTAHGGDWTKVNQAKLERLAQLLSEAVAR